jgi:hypothetical protein
MIENWILGSQCNNYIRLKFLNIFFFAVVYIVRRMVRKLQYYKTHIKLRSR